MAQPCGQLAQKGAAFLQTLYGASIRGPQLSEHGVLRGVVVGWIASTLSPQGASVHKKPGLIRPISRNHGSIPQLGACDRTFRKQRANSETCGRETTWKLPTAQFQATVATFATRPARSPATIVAFSFPRAVLHGKILASLASARR
jgi:hypothetical protein